MADGKIVQCIGAVVDVEFPRNAMPKVFDALKMAGSELTLEVQQQLGDGIVRTIALGSSDGLRRGMTIKNTGQPIMVPTGKATLGRIMDVLGNPIDECGPVSHETTASIHRKAPAYDELSPSRTAGNRHQGYRPVARSPRAVKLVCSVAPGWARPAMELINNIAKRTAAVRVCRRRWRTREGDFYHEMADAKVVDLKPGKSKAAMVTVR